MLTVSACLYRVLYDRALLGLDFTFTFLISTAFSFHAMAGYQYGVKTLQYSFDKAVKVGAQKDSYLLHRVEKVKKALFYLHTANGITVQFFWICTFTSNTVSLILLRTSFGIALLQNIAWLITFYVVETEILNDLEKVSSLPGSGNASERKPNDIISFALVTIPKMKRLRRDLAVSHILNILIYLLGLLSNYWFLLFVYLLPVFYLNTGFAYFSSILVKCGPKVRRKVNGNIKQFMAFNRNSIPRPRGFQFSSKIESPGLETSTELDVTINDDL